MGPRTPGVLETEVDGDLSLYHPKSETVAVLNTTASDVWRLCDGDLTLAEVITALAGAYGVAEGTISDEVIKVVEELTEKGFLADPRPELDQVR